MKIQILGLLIISFLGHSCSTSTIDVCEINEHNVRAEFPKDFFSEGPEFQIVRDTLIITAVLSNNNWHEIYFSSIAYRINHILDTAKCFDLKRRLSQEKLEYNFYPGLKSKENLASFDMYSDSSLLIWESLWFRELNDFIIKAEPNNWYMMDLIIDKLYKSPNSNTGNKNSTLTEIYGRTLRNTGVVDSDLEILNEALTVASYNKDQVNLKPIKRFVDLMRNKSELIIEDQIPDHLKEKNE